METEETPVDIIKRKTISPERKSFLQKEDKNIGELLTKNRRRELDNETLSQSKLDPKCIIQMNKRLVRIEYPGEVKNVNKAIETLGGIESIESSVAEHGHKLALNFHPRNKYSKPCFADKDFRPGILIKVKKDSILGDPNSSEPIKYEYDVEGVSVINFTFNRLCDFQYLPLTVKEPETKLSKTEYIYEKILPLKLPSCDWLENEDAKNIQPFLLPVRFSLYDNAHKKLNVETEKNEPKLKVKTTTNKKQQKSVCKIFGKSKQKISVFVNFNDKDVPTEPLESALKLLKHRGLEERVKRVKQLFEERPIWTKAAIRYNTGLTDEHSKIILPVVAYHFVNGPWRITWVKFGYDPRKDPKARIYQTLDYRIRTAESTKLKVTAKRSYAGKTSFMAPTSIKKISLKNDISTRPKTELDERYYVLRPLTIPPARQMFYQLCDLLLPEIQEMISQLPKSLGSFCHPKNGWLPDNFIEKGRQVVNKHVLKAVQKELLEDKKIIQEKETKEKEKKKEGGSHLDYYNQMLSNIKKGIYKNVGVPSYVPRDIDMEQMEEPELISLSSDDENELTVGEIIQSSIPEKLDDEEQEEESDEGELDMETVQEINEMISQFNVKDVKE